MHAERRNWRRCGENDQSWPRVERVDCIACIVCMTSANEAFPHLRNINYCMKEEKR
jgi:hypothetical protein